jgi:hypothetical protein
MSFVHRARSGQSRQAFGLPWLIFLSPRSPPWRIGQQLPSRADVGVALGVVSKLVLTKQTLAHRGAALRPDPFRTSAESRASFHFHQQLVRPATNATIFSEAEIVR